MKKLLLAMIAVLACGMILTSCEKKATGMIDYGISDGTATGLSHENYWIGLHVDYLDAVHEGFLQAGCSEGQHTHSGGLLLTGEMMSQKQLDKYVKSHADEIIDKKIKELRAKYPGDIKTDVLRFVYSVGDEGEKMVYDKTIEI